VDYEDLRSLKAPMKGIRLEKYPLKYGGNIDLRLLNNLQKGGMDYDRVYYTLHLAENENPTQHLFRR
jgi:hypothetical protein